MRRKMTKESRAACARAGSANLQAWREGKLAPAVKIANEKVADFERKLRAEFPDPPAIVMALLESALNGFTSLLQVSSKQTIGYGRLDRLERLHSLQVETQRVLFRTVRALAAYADTPEAREAVLSHLAATVPPLSEEDRKVADAATATRIKSEVDAAKKKFAWIETGDKPDEE